MNDCVMPDGRVRVLCGDVLERLGEYIEARYPVGQIGRSAAQDCLRAARLYQRHAERLRQGVLALEAAHDD